MIWFHLILVAQLLSILPSTVQAARLKVKNVGAKRANSGQRRSSFPKQCLLAKSNPPSLATLNLTSLPFNGAMLLRSYRHPTPICSGVLLKPWISLVPASCVHELNVEESGAQLQIYNDPKVPKMKLVEIHKVITHPEYVPGKEEHNFAILWTFSQKNWNTREFLLPKRHYSSENIIKRNLFTQVKLWDTLDDYLYFPRNIQGVVQEKISMCKKDLELDELQVYCVSNCWRIEYNPVDYGSSFFINDGKPNGKTLLGIYTNLTKDTSLDKHVYLSIWPSIDWIRQMVHEHPVPPL